MSEVQSRPSAQRGRISTRGGRAGFGSRGSRNSRGHATNGDKAENMINTPIDDDSEVGQLKKKYGIKVHTIKEMFPEWTDEDVVFALQETDGDLEITVERITDGTITQWGEVSKVKKERSRSKVPKDSATATLGESTNTPRASRGGRNAQEGSRGGRGRYDRGRGGRGRGGVHTNGTRSKDAVDISTPTEESPAYENTSKTHDSDLLHSSKQIEDTRGATATAATPAIAPQVSSSIIPEGAKKSWASMFAPAPVPAPKKELVPVPKVSTTTIPEPIEVVPAQPEHEAGLPQPAPDLSPEPEDNKPIEIPTFEEVEVSIAPSKDELTETNLEQVLDTSSPVPTATQASTAASSWDPRSGATSCTPYLASQQPQPIQAIRPPASGFAASAMKATAATGRTPSYQRRVLDQEEAVRMPGNREVDRATVQFGAFSLNGTSDEDVDGDREEPETRAQPPQHSPVTHPRAALPPAPTQPTAHVETLQAPKDAPGLPAPTHPVSAPGLPSPNTQSGAQTMSHQGSQGSHHYSQYGRYGQPGTQDQAAFGQKPYDPFSQQAPSAQSQFEGYPAQQTPAAQTQQSTAFSSAPSEYSSYYTADQRNAYQNYYGQQYGQQQGAQGGQAQQDSTASQQRPFGGYNVPQADSASQFPQSSGQQSQSRYATAGEAQPSGHATPNPPTQPQQQPAPTAQAQQGHPTQPQGQPGQYPYGHPYYSSPYYAAYMNQFQQGYGQGNYAAGPYGAKGGMYNQPHQGYGISPQAPYDHTASPAAGAFAQSSLHGRDNALGGGLGDYGRAGSQPSQGAQPLGGTGGFGMQDAFGRGSSYQGQAQHYGQQGSQPGGGDDLKPFSDAKSANGPSPLLSQAARPGSAANSVPGQSVLPPPQSTQQGYGAYPGHLQHGLHGSQTGSQYGALGGVGHQPAGQGHQSSQYGGYGQGFGNYYGNNQQRGGWGNNYGH